MPHAFSIEIHDFISKKNLLADERKDKAVSEKNKAIQLYCEGELMELRIMREYLVENIDLKTQKYF